MGTAKHSSSSSSSFRSLLLMVASLVVLCSSHAVCSVAAVEDGPSSSSSTTTTTGSAANAVEDNEGEIDLYALSDQELEEICTVRGFELVKPQDGDDPSTNAAAVFTHDDYVEAARQCLAIEQDMEEIIAEHPEILNELEEERERMIAEKERLEEELLAAQQHAKAETQPTPQEQQQQQKNHQHQALQSQPNGDEEIVDLDVVKQDNDEAEEVEFDDNFDVVGHQEPISDSRVHEEVIAHHEAGGTTIQDSTQQQQQQNMDDTDASASSSSASSSLSASQTNSGDKGIGLRVTLDEFRQGVVRDATLVANVIFPKSMRGPTKQAFIRFAKIAKETAVNVYHFVLRYVQALVETRQKANAQKKQQKQRQQQTDQEEASNETITQQASGEGSTASS